MENEAVMHEFEKLAAQRVVHQIAIEKLVERMDIPYTGLSDLGNLRGAIVLEISNPPREDRNIQVHACNEVMKDFEPKYDVGYSYEDSDIPSMEAAEEFFDYLDELVPGAFVLVTTGDLITTPCGGWHADKRHDCETYDPHYWYYIVPRVEWERQQEDVMQRDAEWRSEKSKCSCPAD